MSVTLKWLRRTTAVLAVGYPLVLVGIALMFRFCGERWWATEVGLYLPRVAFAAPLPIFLFALVALRLRRYLWAQLAAALLILFPLMGFVTSWPSSPRKDAPSVRVLSFNVDSAFFGLDKVTSQIASYSPDIVVLQETLLDAEKLPETLRSQYGWAERSSQFILASKFPVVETTDPDKLPFSGRNRSPRFMRYLIETPLGRVALYNVHPISPRGGFYELRGKGLRHEILSGHIFSGEAAPELEENGALRALQVQTCAEMAAAETYPVIIAGDTNLPGLSPALRNLSRYQDGFAQAGFGFGYTFQSYRRWMRLDRIFAGEPLRFTHFEVGCKDASDHLCVVADLQRRE